MIRTYPEPIPIEGKPPSRARAARMLQPPPRLPRLERRPAGLRCPYCRERTARAEGARVYVCHNDECPGSRDAQEPGQHASILIVDAARGAQLVPWKLGQRINQERRMDPLAALRKADR